MVRNGIQEVEISESRDPILSTKNREQFISLRPILIVFPRNRETRYSCRGKIQQGFRQQEPRCTTDYISNTCRATYYLEYPQIMDNLMVAKKQP